MAGTQTAPTDGENLSVARKEIQADDSRIPQDAQFELQSAGAESLAEDCGHIRLRWRGGESKWQLKSRYLFRLHLEVTEVVVAAVEEGAQFFGHIAELVNLF